MCIHIPAVMFLQHQNDFFYKLFKAFLFDSLDYSHFWAVVKVSRVGKKIKKAIRIVLYTSYFN